MNSERQSFGNLVAQGWVLMFLIFLCMVTTQFMNIVICTSVSGAGSNNMTLMVILMLLHAFVPMLVFSYSERWFRWVIAGFTLCFGLALISHEIHMHFVTKRVFGVFDLIEVAHHALTLWVATLAVRWAKEADTSPYMPMIEGSV